MNKTLCTLALILSFLSHAAFASSTAYRCNGFSSKDAHDPSWVQIGYLEISMNWPTQIESARLGLAPTDNGPWKYTNYTYLTPVTQFTQKLPSDERSNGYYLADLKTYLLLPKAAPKKPADGFQTRVRSDRPDVILNCLPKN